jgi:hypothetical protein
MIVGNSYVKESSGDGINRPFFIFKKNDQELRVQIWYDLDLHYNRATFEFITGIDNIIFRGEVPQHVTDSLIFLVYDQKDCMIKDFIKGLKP